MIRSLLILLLLAVPASAQDLLFPQALFQFDQDVQHPTDAGPFQIAAVITDFRFANHDFHQHLGFGVWAQWNPKTSPVGFEAGLNLVNGRMEAERDASGDKINRSYSLGVLSLGFSFRDAGTGPASWFSWQVALASLACRFDITMGFSFFFADWDNSQPVFKVGPYVAVELSTISYKSVGGFIRLMFTDPAGEPRTQTNSIYMLTMVSFGFAYNF